ncbi:MAG: hypothetical protein A2X25_04155 [Chloroflexi bacterium GWB2_49_20]|nr:MAG: hypothetical protein A2X25_04155 [Chloroflexi bacterium GWB2_49_20]OGN77899.1 MAG: hypothetical protein A2X26_02055 [Chloroflexi bacterium GWC2_49_37]OGN82720.1 MAG: hypothetical protein A2X27_08975 [Chloroflexi bacterium GWD2_49_16]
MRAASYPSTGIQPINRHKISTESPIETVFERLVNLIHVIWPVNHEVAAISVASAGPLNPKTGFIYDAPNIPGWKDFPLGDKLREIFPVPIFIGNDANLAAMGEWKYGNGIDHSDLIFLTISTGIGGGIICNNALMEGHNGLAAELGHITVQPDGLVCSCGKLGHLEALASGPAIVAYVRLSLLSGQTSTLHLDKEFSAYDVALAAKTGDQLAVRAYAHAGFYLGQALASLIHIFNPSIIILGGGVAQSGALLFEPMLEKMYASVMEPSYLQDLEIVPARLGDDAGLLGALALARQKLQNS